MNWSQIDGPYVRPLASVQLQTRHWIMRDENGEVTSEVRGEGVIGEFPILVPGRLIDIFVKATVALALSRSLQYPLRIVAARLFLKVVGSTSHG